MRRIRFIYCVLLGMSLLVISSCCKENGGSPAKGMCNVTVISSLNGLGDNGYNDLIMKGVMDFNEKESVDLSMRTPRSLAQAGELIQCWLDERPDRKEQTSILILASNEYEALLREKKVALDANQKILLFESDSDDWPEGVFVFSIRRYGVAYLAGCLARECSSAYILAAMRDNPLLKAATDGFKDGYAEHGGKAAEVVYLAEDEKGFSAPNLAYEVMARLVEGFVFPLAGGSNSGVYKYTRDDMFSLFLVAGMDVDCSAYSTRIPFSVEIGIDRIVEESLRTLVHDERLDSCRSFGLTDGIDIKMNPYFYENLIVWENFYDDPSYWTDAYEMFLQEAMEKEKEYYGHD